MTGNDAEFMTFREAADLLGVTRGQIYKLRRKGKLERAVRSDGHPGVTRSSVEYWRVTRTKGPKPKHTAPFSDDDAHSSTTEEE